MNAIVAEGLVKVYRSRKNEVRALDGLDLTVEEGTVLGLLGPNGAGKTTLFNLITRLYRPNSGRILFDGKDLTRTPAYRIVRLGIGFERYDAGAIEPRWPSEPVKSAIGGSSKPPSRACGSSTEIA